MPDGATDLSVPEPAEALPAFAGLELVAVAKRFGATTVVEDAYLRLPLGQFACFVGPSGCGKTTLLRLIAGLEAPSAGRIVLNGTDITALPAHRRRFGMVFQSLALFPHLTVAGNIAYSLKLRGWRAQERRARVDELLTLIRLPGIADRPVSTLSGGQRQRVAIARALAQEPQVFLLDEPFSALDAALREEMQVELRQLQQQLKITTILVTHDQREAMTLGDQVVVMKSGRIQQAGPPAEIYRRPCNRFVAGFFGACNLLPARRLEAGSVEVAGQMLALADDEHAGEMTLAIRPEDVRCRPVGTPGPAATPATITFIRDLGASYELTLDCDGLAVRAVLAPADWTGAAAGDAVWVSFPEASCRLLGA